MFIRYPQRFQNAKSERKPVDWEWPIKALYICIYKIIIIIIIIISIFKEDNVFSITASLPYGPPVNTDIDYYRTFFFFGLVYFCKCCEVSCAIFC